MGIRRGSSKGLWYVVAGCLCIAVGSPALVRDDVIGILAGGVLILNGAYWLYTAWRLK